MLIIETFMRKTIKKLTTDQIKFCWIKYPDLINLTIYTNLYIIYNSNIYCRSIETNPHIHEFLQV